MSAAAPPPSSTPASACAASSFDPFEQAMRDLAARLRLGEPMQESVLSRLFLHVAALMAQRLDEPLRPHSLNATLWNSLVVIYASEGHRLKPSEVSTLMNSSRTNGTRVARDLERLGLVRRVGSQEDRRQVFLQLTARGVEFVRSRLPERRSQLRALFAGFPADDLAELERLLRGLLARLD